MLALTCARHRDSNFSMSPFMNLETLLFRQPRQLKIVQLNLVFYCSFTARAMSEREDYKTTFSASVTSIFYAISTRLLSNHSALEPPNLG